jgi:hypothetical protein
MVVEARLTEQIDHGSAYARLGVACPNTSRAIRAWKMAPAHIAHGSSVVEQLAAGQTVVADRARGFAKGGDLGMRRGIASRRSARCRRAHYLAVANHQRADRTFAALTAAGRARALPSIHVSSLVGSWHLRDGSDAGCDGSPERTGYRRARA